MSFGVSQFIAHAKRRRSTLRYPDVALSEPFDIPLIDVNAYSLCLGLQTHTRFTDVLRNTVSVCLMWSIISCIETRRPCLHVQNRQNIFSCSCGVLFILLFGRAIVHILFSYILQPCSETSLVSHSRRYQ